MTYRRNGINPLLISVVTGQDLREIPANPTGKYLPGKYAQIVSKALAHIPKPSPGKRLKLTCTECGQSGQYDVGLIAFDPEKYLSSQKARKTRKYLGWKSPIYRVFSLPPLQFGRVLATS